MFDMSLIDTYDTNTYIIWYRLDPEINPDKTSKVYIKEHVRTTYIKLKLAICMLYILQNCQWLETDRATSIALTLHIKIDI